MGRVNLDGVESKEELEERIFEEAMKVVEEMKRKNKEDIGKQWLLLK